MILFGGKTPIVDRMIVESPQRCDDYQENLNGQYAGQAAVEKLAEKYYPPDFCINRTPFLYVWFFTKWQPAVI
jgi:hypothetical protein